MAQPFQLWQVEGERATRSGSVLRPFGKGHNFPYNAITRFFALEAWPPQLLHTRNLHGFPRYRCRGRGRGWWHNHHPRRKINHFRALTAAGGGLVPPTRKKAVFKVFRLAIVDRCEGSRLIQPPQGLPRLSEALQAIGITHPKKNPGQFPIRQRAPTQ